MTTFTFGVPAGFVDDSTTSAALGVNAAGKLTDLDIGKAVKLIGDSNYGLCADGDDIEGVLIAVEPVTVNAGFGFGTVQTKERIVVKNIGAGVVAIGAYVIAAAQGAVGTAITPVSTGIMTGVYATPVKAGAGAIFRWRIVAHLGGAGAVNSFMLAEKVV